MTNRQNRILLAADQAIELIKSNFSTFEAVEAACEQFGLIDDEAFDKVCQIIAL